MLRRTDSGLSALVKSVKSIAISDSPPGSQTLQQEIDKVKSKVNFVSSVRFEVHLDNQASNPITEVVIKTHNPALEMRAYHIYDRHENPRFEDKGKVAHTICFEIWSTAPQNIREGDNEGYRTVIRTRYATGNNTKYAVVHRVSFVNSTDSSKREAEYLTNQIFNEIAPALLSYSKHDAAKFLTETDPRQHIRRPNTILPRE